MDLECRVNLGDVLLHPRQDVAVEVEGYPDPGIDPPSMKWSDLKYVI